MRFEQQESALIQGATLGHRPVGALQILKRYSRIHRSIGINEIVVDRLAEPAKTPE